MTAKNLLRVVFAGSVDDGKSTLIGRLLHDGGGVYEDQLRGAHTRDGLQLAFLTDGLRAEREQGITIDVAYRYFSTTRRKFIIADTPGHQQFTRNMVSGSSLAQAAVILVDGTRAFRNEEFPLPQTVRHAAIARLLGIRHIVFAINKMDLLDMRQEAFDAIRQRCAAFAQDCLPVSALHGDNVVSRSARLPWFHGPTLLEYLESVPDDAGNARAPFRYPVQTVLPGDVYCGTIASGSIAVGDEVMVLPSRIRARVTALPAYGGDLHTASAPASIAISLDRPAGIGRGDMLADPHDPPAAVRQIRADLVWLDDRRLTPGRRLLLKHTTRQLGAEVTEIYSGPKAAGKDACPSENVAQASLPAGFLDYGDIGSVKIETRDPLFCDSYDANRKMGSFIMMDPASSETLAAGIIREALENNSATGEGSVIWLTGLSSAGKTTLGRSLSERLWTEGRRVVMLDGDEIRRELWPDLGYSKADRDENIRRLGFLAAMLARSGVTVLVAAISPYRAARRDARKQVSKFVEVYVNAPLETCERRDVKGLYRRARAGEIHGVTGVDDPYEPPELPEVECFTNRETVPENLDKILRFLKGTAGEVPQ